VGCAVVVIRHRTTVSSVLDRWQKRRACISSRVVVLMIFLQARVRRIALPNATIVFVLQTKKKEKRKRRKKGTEDAPCFGHRPCWLVLQKIDPRRCSTRKRRPRETFVSFSKYTHLIKRTISAHCDPFALVPSQTAHELAFLVGHPFVLLLVRLFWCVSGCSWSPRPFW